MKKTKNIAVRVLQSIVFMLLLAAMVMRLDSALKLVRVDNLCPRYYEYPDGTYDVVFVGTSLVMCGIYPMEIYEDYGMAAYNLGTVNQSLEASYYLAKDAIEKDHPALVVLDCSRAWHDEETMEPEFIHDITDTMPYLNRNRIDMIRALSGEDADLKSLYFPLIAFHTRWQEVSYTDALPTGREESGGAKITGRVASYEVFEEAKNVPNALPDTSRKYIEKTIDLCRENNTNIMLITMPVISNGPYMEQQRYNVRVSAAREITELAVQKGVIHIDYMSKENDPGLDPEKDTFDGEHLNRWGARKFSKLLAEKIWDTFNIPDRRGEGGAYGDIEKDLEDYPLNRMKYSLRDTKYLCDYTAVLKSDVKEAPVGDVVILAALNGKVSPDLLTEEDAALLREIGIRQDLHSWQGSGWLAVIDDGEAVYETASDKTSDSYSGSAGKIRYEIFSGSPDEASGEVLSSASIRVNGMEYATQDRGLQIAVFDKTTGDLLDACWINIFHPELACTHDNH